MKAGRVDVTGVADVTGLARRVLQTRWREARAMAAGLERRDPQSLHAFRIACKRLRYALERFAECDCSLEQPAQRLASLQDALGEAHDRDVLLGVLPPGLTRTRRRLRDERAAFAASASALWARAQSAMRDCALIVFE